MSATPVLAAAWVGVAVGAAVLGASHGARVRRVWRRSAPARVPAAVGRPWWLRLLLRLPALGGLPGGEEAYAVAFARADLGEPAEAAALWRRELVLAASAAAAAAVLALTGQGAVPATGAAAAAAGLLAPLSVRRAVQRRAAQRQARLLAELPAFVDLLVLGLEGGLPIRQALAVAARHAPPAWRELGGRLVARLEYGAPLERAVAASREGLEPGPGRAVLRALVVGERAGVDQVRLLRRQAEHARALLARRWQERVGALPVQLMLVGTLLLLPPVLVMLLLPNLLTVVSRW